MNDSCPLCHSIESISTGNNEFFIKELKTGYVLLCHHQFYKGYVLFVYIQHKSELHELSKPEKILYLEEMSLVAEAIYRAFKPKKINYELLGNGVPHLHWHIIPRYNNDPNGKEPIWIVDPAVRKAKKYIPNSKEIMVLKKQIADILDQISPRTV